MDDDEEIDDKDEKGGADELLRDFQYALKCQFMEKGRNLRVSCLKTFYFPAKVQGCPLLLETRSI